MGFTATRVTIEFDVTRERKTIVGRDLGRQVGPVLCVIRKASLSRVPGYWLAMGHL